MDCFNHKSPVDIHIKKPRHSEVFLFIASIVLLKQGQNYFLFNPSTTCLVTSNESLANKIPPPRE